MGWEEPFLDFSCLSTATQVLVFCVMLVFALAGYMAGKVGL